MRSDGANDRSPTLGLAAELLGVASIEHLALSLTRRAMLSSGRFEAHEFGQNAHSSASAGGLAAGISGIHELPSQLVDPVVAAAASLVGRNGEVRGHDRNPASGATNWAISQLLFGLVQRETVARRFRREITKLVTTLLERQDRSGGWPLRHGEEPALAYTFYPTLALGRALSARLGDETTVRESLRLAKRFVESEMSLPHVSVMQRILALHVLDQARGQSRDSLDMRQGLLSQCVNGHGRLHIEDEPVFNSRQPMWHMVLWRPLLYLCVRTWASPMSSVNAQLGGELLSTFDSRQSAWLGPAAAVDRRTGVSWASALALRAVVDLSDDLVHEGVSADQFRDRARALARAEYEYDVVISFGGPDRALAEQISQRLKVAGMRVFYDKDHQHTLLGEDVAAHLHSTYFTKSRFAVVLLSPAFLASTWAGNWEWHAVLARMQQQRGGYVLPYIVEDVVMPGLSPSIGYARASEYSVEQFCDLVVRKIWS
jgi:hypothetical protein